MSYPGTIIPLITIGGVDVTKHVDPTQTKISNVLTKQVDTAALAMFDTASLNITEWQEVIITDQASGNRLFGGYVQTGQEKGFASGTRLDINPLNCADYSCLLDHIRVKKPYAPVGATITDKAILQDLFGTYCSIIDASTYVQAVNAYPRITFARLTLRAILDKLASAANGFWYVDYYKKLHFGLWENNAAPFGLSDVPAHIDLSTTFPFDAFTRNIDGTGIVNRVEVVGGIYLTGDQTIYLAGTGQSAIASIGLAIHEQSTQAQILVWRNDGTQASPVWTAMTVITQLSHTPTGNEVIFDANNKTMTQAAVWPALTNAIKIGCRYEVPLDDRYSDASSFAQYNLPCYLDGVVTDSTITDKTTSQMIASGFLKGNSLGPKTYTCTVYQPGLRAGMILPVEASLRSINGSFLIQTVTLNLDNGGFATYDLALGSYAPSLIDTLAKIAQNAQPLPAYNQSDVLQEMLQIQESLGALQETAMTVSASNAPYYVGSARCGYAKVG